MKRYFILLIAFVMVFGLSHSTYADQIVTLRSGNGSVGSTDSLITMLLGPADSGFPNAFTSTDFAAADAGNFASIVTPNGAWQIPHPNIDPSSQWISTGPGGRIEGGTALYAMDFVLTDSLIASATLNMFFSVDNILGGGPNQGVFLNGTAISGNTILGGFRDEFHISRTDIAPLLISGKNTLYINSTDQGGPSGLLFSATFETVAAPVPEPTTILLLGIGLAGLVGGAVRRKF